MTDRQVLLDALSLQQQQEADDLRQRIRGLEIKAKRCVSEIAWRFFPDGGVRRIDLEPAEQMMGELFETLRTLQQIDPRKERDDG